MKNKVSFLEKISSGKGFYITCAVSVCVIVAAIAVIYNSSMDMLRGIVVPETTAQVQKNQQGVSDPRVTAKTTAKKEETTTEKQSTTAPKTTNEPSSVITTAAPTEPTFAKSLSYVAPLSGEVAKAFSISPVFDETMEDWRSHGGTDYAAEKGTEAKAVGNGIVSKVLSDPSWGYIIEINCGDFTARYCGLEQGTTLQIGDIVEQGQVVGKVGTVPCESAQESHLHFEILQNDDRVDPEKAIKK